MTWLEALLLGVIQGLTEFLPISSSGHLMIFRELLGSEPEGFLDFTLTVHFATVLSTIVVFRSSILDITRGLFQFKYNDQTNYFFKICLSMVPIALVGFFFKDKVAALFGESLTVVAVFLLLTALLLVFSDLFANKVKGKRTQRNGISYWQALVVGIGQAFAVFPGLSRSGITIATGLLCGVKRNNMAQFSFLMVLIPIVGEQLLELPTLLSASDGIEKGVGTGALICGFFAAFIAGLIACKLMIAVVRSSRLSWFAAYCTFVSMLIFILS